MKLSFEEMNWLYGVRMKVKLSEIECVAREHRNVTMANDTAILLCQIIRAAKEYETYLPNIEVAGAEKYSNQLVTAMKLREALSKIEFGGEA